MTLLINGNFSLRMTVFYRILNSIGLIGVLVVNYLANALPINGYTTGELSALYPNLFVPAGITFAIWGLIYLFLIAFTIFQWTPWGKPVASTVKAYFFISCLLNSSWILAWHYRQVVFSVLIMFALLITLIKLYRITRSVDQTWYFKLFSAIPFSIYLGWICVATIANFTTMLVDLDLQPVYPEIWPAIMLAITQLLVFGVNRRKANLAYSLTIIWAIGGIILKQSQQDGPELIIYTGYACIGLTTLMYVIAALRQHWAG